MTREKLDPLFLVVKIFYENPREDSLKSTKRHKREREKKYFNSRTSRFSVDLLIKPLPYTLNSFVSYFVIVIT